jgi:hypothetical protein
MTLVADNPAKHAKMLRDQHDIEAMINSQKVYGRM